MPSYQTNPKFQQPMTNKGLFLDYAIICYGKLGTSILMLSNDWQRRQNLETLILEIPCSCSEGTNVTSIHIPVLCIHQENREAQSLFYTDVAKGKISLNSNATILVSIYEAEYQMQNNYLE